jgi:hypothetical protein
VRGAGGLAECERHPLGRLRQHDHVGDVGVERVVEQRGVNGMREQDDRRPRVLADLGQVAARKRAAGNGVDDDVDLARPQRPGRLSDVAGRADELDVGLPGKGVAQVADREAEPRDEDAQ